MSKIISSVSDGVAVIELNDPPANTYSYEMMRELDEAVLAARMDADVHVIVLTGAGERFFCAGANIGMLQGADPRFKYYFCLHANETMNRLEQTPKLVIAAINGHCVGGGFEVAMAADLRAARTGAGKVGLPEVALGAPPGTGGTQRLVRLVGKAKAMELMVSSVRISKSVRPDSRGGEGRLGLTTWHTTTDRSQYWAPGSWATASRTPRWLPDSRPGSTTSPTPPFRRAGAPSKASWPRAWNSARSRRTAV
jgi:hypothetical protein